MKALVVGVDHHPEYVSHYPDPIMVRDGALVRVRRAGIDFTDVEVAKGYRRYAGPLGNAFVGDVVKASVGNEQWVGAHVVGEINYGCGGPACEQLGEAYCPHRFVLGVATLNCPYSSDPPTSGGAFAEYLSLPVRNLHRVPAGVTDRSAIFCEPIAAAVRILEQVPIKPHESVIVRGDGPLAFGVAQVLGWSGAKICVVGDDPVRIALFTKQGIAACLAADWQDSGDVVVECTGDQAGPQWAVDHANPHGRIVLKSTIKNVNQLDLSAVVVNEVTIVGSRSGPFGPVLQALVERRLVVDSFVTDTFPLEDGITALERASARGVGKVELIIASE